jgi:hypothetical protein
MKSISVFRTPSKASRSASRSLSQSEGIAQDDRDESNNFVNTKASENDEREGCDDIPVERNPARRSQRSATKRGGTSNSSKRAVNPPLVEFGVPVTGFIDPFEAPPRHNNETGVGGGEPMPGHGTFLGPSDIHLNTIHSEEDLARLRLLAGKLSADWKSSDFMAPALARRLRDFQFAQDKRRRKYGDERPWGILGLYDHLSAIRLDVEWAEDSAWRRANGEP